MNKANRLNNMSMICDSKEWVSSTVIKTRLMPRKAKEEDYHEEIIIRLFRSFYIL